MGGLRFYARGRLFRGEPETGHPPATIRVIDFNSIIKYLHLKSPKNMNAMIRQLPRLSTASNKLSRCAFMSRSVHIEKKIEELGIELPAAPAPKANYNIVCRVPGENTLYVSGHLPIKADGTLITGALAPEGVKICGELLMS